ncbi:MAG: ester cyclase [Verrucomicrobiales bacterium]|nr:ester cyclase [Verrucomicrobiales bacterium]
MEVSAKQLTGIWFDRVWNGMDRSAVGELMHAGCEVLGLGNTVVGPAGFLRIHESFKNAFDQIYVDVVDLVSEGDEVAGHARFAARHRFSGKEVDLIFSFSARFAEGKLIRVRNVIDYTSLLAQLDLLEPEKLKAVFESPH